MTRHEPALGGPSRYQVLLLPSAARALRKLPPEAKRRIQAAIDLLAEGPRPPAAKRLVARPEWRVRTGDYRVLYRIDDGVLIVVVIDLCHRREMLRDLAEYRAAKAADDGERVSLSELVSELDE